MLDLIIDLLMPMQYRADPGPLIVAGPDGAEGTLAAAAAVAAGLPGRARSILAAPDANGSEPTTTRALDRMALHRMVNWFPDGGGALLLPGAGPVPERVPDAPPDGAGPGAGAGPDGADLAVRLCELDEAYLSIRASARSAMGAGAVDHGGEIAAVLNHFALSVAGVAASPHPRADAARRYAQVLQADLLHALARDDEAADTLALALADADDAALAGHADLVRGDWAATPDSSPLVLGLSLGGGAAVSGRVSDPVAAAQFWASAEGHYRAAGLQAGVAAAQLRTVLTAPADGADERLAVVGRAAGLAGAADLGLLTDVHLRIAARRGGLAVPGADPGQVEAYGLGEGSPAYARGLLRLMVSVANTWRAAGDLAAGRRLLDDAAAVARGLGVREETHLVAGTAAGLYSGAYPLLAAVVGLTDARISRGPVDTATEWARRAERLTRLYRDTSVGDDPTALRQVEALLTQLLAVSPPAPPEPEVAEHLQKIVGEVRATLDDIGVLAPLSEGRTAQAAGRPDLAEPRLHEALDRALAGPSTLAFAVLVLMAMDLSDEALTLARTLSPQLPADIAALLLTRAGDAAAGLARDPAAPADDAGYADLSRWAERNLLAGNLDDGTAFADRAVEAFEALAARYGRDVLRSQAGDSGDVGAAYLSAVLGHAGLADRADGQGDPGRAGAERSAALLAADRGRAGLLGLAEVVSAAAADPATRNGVAAWLEAGSAWGTAVEQAAADLTRTAVPTDEEVARARRRVDDGERTLVTAETDLERIAPEVMRQRAGSAAGTVTFDQITGALPAGTLLLEFHVFDRSLVTFAIDGSGLHVHRQDVRQSFLADLARRFHVGVFSVPTSIPPGVDTDLARLLLGPVAELVTPAPRMVVVPHGPLHLVPWHLLPGADGAPLGLTRVISVLPAAALLPVLAGREHPLLDRGSLSVGDPDFAAGHRLRALPGARIEARAVAARLPGGTSLVGAAATRDAVRSAAPGRSVVHLATHGLVDDAHPYLSHLALAGDDVLSIGDLMGSALGSDVVLLSACHTGRGRSTVGGDLIGLARAALVAGAAHLVVSLCPLDDEAGCIATVDLADRLAAGRPVADAVHETRLAMRELDGAARQQRYADLRAAYAGDDPAVGARDLDEDVTPDRLTGPGVPYFYAPLVHVGVC